MSSKIKKKSKTRQQCECVDSVTSLPFVVIQCQISGRAGPGRPGAGTLRAGPGTLRANKILKSPAGPGPGPGETPHTEAICADFFSDKGVLFELIASSIADSKLSFLTRAPRGALSSMRVYGAPCYLKLY